MDDADIVSYSTTNPRFSSRLHERQRFRRVQVFEGPRENVQSPGGLDRLLVRYLHLRLILAPSLAFNFAIQPADQSTSVKRPS
jgi:hypothetical protein